MPKYYICQLAGLRPQLNQPRSRFERVVFRSLLVGVLVLCDISEYYKLPSHLFLDIPRSLALTRRRPYAGALFLGETPMRFALLE